MSNKLREKDEQLQNQNVQLWRKDAMIKRQKEWAVTTTAKAVNIDLHENASLAYTER